MAKEHLLDIYGTQLYLATTKREWKQLAKALPVLANDHPQDASGQVTTLVQQRKRQPSRLVVVIWVNVRGHANAEPGELLDTAAHEASHAAGRILEHAGHVVDGTDEPRAYLCGWLTRFIYEGCA